MIAAVFSMQGLGQLGASVVALITAEAFKESYLDVTTIASCHERCQLAADRSWRIIVGVGALPACLALYYRVTIPETPRYTFDVEQDVEKADADIKAYMASKSKGEVDPELQFRMKKQAGPAYNTPSASWRDTFAFFAQWKNFKTLTGTALSWFFLVCHPAPGLHFDTLICEAGSGILWPRIEQYLCASSYWLWRWSQFLREAT